MSKKKVMLSQFDDILKTEDIRHQSFNNFVNNFKKQRDEMVNLSTVLADNISKISKKKQKGGGEIETVIKFRNKLNSQIPGFYTNQTEYPEGDMEKNITDFFGNYRLLDEYMKGKMEKLYKYTTLSEQMNQTIRSGVDYGKKQIENILIGERYEEGRTESAKEIKSRCQSCIKIFGEELEKEYNKGLYDDSDKMREFLLKMNKSYLNLRNSLYLHYLSSQDYKYVDLLDKLYKCYNNIINNNLDINKNICAREYIPEKEEEILDPYAEEE
jgi:hypothetical protein